MKSNKEIKKEVEQTCAHVNRIFFLAIQAESKVLEKVLDNFENFKETFPKISIDEWGVYSDMKLLGSLLYMHGYDGWLVEVVVPERKRFITDNKTNAVVRKKWVYCDSFTEIPYQMLEFSKSVFEEDIIKFNRDRNGKE